MTDDAKPTPSPSFGVRLSKPMLAAIDGYRAGFPIPPSRAAVFRKIIEEWIDHQTPKPRVPLEENGR